MPFLGRITPPLTHVAVAGGDEQVPVLARQCSDIAAGIFGYCGILTALVARERTSKGTTIDIAMLDSTFALLEHGLMDALGVHVRPKRLGNRHPFMYPFDRH
jgi:crotonobetainyl-CoA:carnitine CoA-transferase CaiB-like acyl-CoA transferase